MTVLPSAPTAVIVALTQSYSQISQTRVSLFGAGPGSYVDFATLSFHVPRLESASHANQAPGYERNWNGSGRGFPPHGAQPIQAESARLAPTSEVEPSAAKKQYQDNDDEKCICAHLVFRNPAVFCVCASGKPIPRERTSSDVVLNAFTDDLVCRNRTVLTPLQPLP